MTPQELHDECHRACMECPQFKMYPNHLVITGLGEFGEIPKKGMYAVVQFWRNEDLLFGRHGYSAALSDDAIKIFNNIDRVIRDAIKNYCESL